MTAETTTGVFNSAFMVRNHITANFVPNPDVATDFPSAENFADDNGDNWVNYAGNINPAEGYLVRPQSSISDGNATYNMTYSQGTLNNGDISFPVVFNTTKNDSPNVLGNPYASSISAADFINQNSMVDEIYFWEHLTPPSSSLPGYNSMNFSMEDISMYNLMGGVAAANDLSGLVTAPNGIISTGQGFGIKATAAGTALFTNSMRRLTNNTTLRSNDLEADRIWLKVQNETYRMQGTTLLGFSDETTNGIDAGYDSRRLANIVSLYSHLDDGSEEFGIQSRGSFDSSTTIPLGFSTLIDEDAGLNYTVSIADIEGANFDGVTVYLVDHLTNDVTNLGANSYQFVSGKGTYNGRFTLQFVPEFLAVSNFGMDSIVLFPNPVNDRLIIANPNNQDLEAIEIYDIMGRTIKTVDLNEMGSQKSIEVSDLTSGSYIVVLYGPQGRITKKLIKE